MPTNAVRTMSRRSSHTRLKDRIASCRPACIGATGGSTPPGPGCDSSVVCSFAAVCVTLFLCLRISSLCH
jgi:hypothetical protein